MNAKFQAKTKELDEKFAAIPKGVKRQYDRHRFIRRAVMLFLAFLLIILTFSSLIPLIFLRGLRNISMPMYPKPFYFLPL